jgi:Na+/H+-translocating membrane pyrophosphatase
MGENRVFDFIVFLPFCRVGDPFKDTAGPSIHVLIKMLATITLVMAPLFLD